MSKIYYFNGKCYSNRKVRSSTVGVLRFADWLTETIGDNKWEVMPKYERDKLYRRYQIRCAELNTDYECPTLFGIRGLFG
jgi:hypothetical protein